MPKNDVEVLKKLNLKEIKNVIEELLVKAQKFEKVAIDALNFSMV